MCHSKNSKLKPWNLRDAWMILSRPEREQQFKEVELICIHLGSNIKIVKMLQQMPWWVWRNIKDHATTLWAPGMGSHKKLDSSPGEGWWRPRLTNFLPCRRRDWSRYCFTKDFMNFEFFVHAAHIFWVSKYRQVRTLSVHVRWRKQETRLGSMQCTQYQMW